MGRDKGQVFMKEIRFHGRGGQGAVMAVGMLASALVHAGKYAAAFGMFGPERRGAPVMSFLRSDDKPIRQHTQIYQPDCLVVIDPRLIYTQDIFGGLKEGGILVINAPKEAKELYSAEVALVGVVDATKIGLEEIGTPITNTCMMGAFARVTGWVQLDSLMYALGERFNGTVLERNIRCIERGFEEVEVFKC